MFSRSFLCSCAVVCASLALVQASAQPAQQQSRSGQGRANSSNTDTVAYIYVSATPLNSTVNEIVGFTAARNGKLTPVPGSPFNADVTSMAVDGLFLFGVNRNRLNVDAYSIESNGALELRNSTDVADYYSYRDDCAATGPIVLDHTGQTLYSVEYRGDGCSNNAYASLAVDVTTGGLANLGEGVVDNWIRNAPTFIGNNVYAYYASCIGDMYWQLSGVQRAASGLLERNPNFNRTMPDPKPGDFWCPSQVAADPTNHVAVSMQPVKSFMPDGGEQIASFTAGDDGSLTATTTEPEMPVTDVGHVLQLNMAPSGKLLAVGGAAGLQIFNFNGAAPVTRYTGLLTNDRIDQMFWDNDNHLYAISSTAGKLYVFTITPTRAEQAPGSPHALTGAQNIIVQPWPLPWAQ